MPFRHSAAVALATATLLSSVSAAAHFSLDRGTTHESRYGDAEIKQGPCGREGGTRGQKVYTYRPGETVTVEIVEFIGHPGYFRIAFDDDGDDAFVDPQTVAPLNRECMEVAEDHCGEPDFFNNDAVLLDNLDPHVPENPLEEKTYSWEVTLPSVACDNCTLQVIQVMTDAPGIHAPYDPNSPTADDIYYQCIDLVLEGEPVEGAVSDGGTEEETQQGLGSSSGGDDGGCAVAAPHRRNGSWGATAVLGLASLLLRRRALRGDRVQER